MSRPQCVLGLVVMYVGWVHSWDVAVTHGDQLDFFYANGTKINTVRFNSNKLAALAYDEVHNMLLYVDKQSNNDAICGHGISSMENKCVVERNGRNIHGVAFDPATELLFFTDTNERSVNWISLKSESNKYGNLLAKLDYGIPTDVAIDSCREYVYWINTDLTTPTIERARFDGSEREVLININSFNSYYKMEPHSLTIDQQTQRMYWIEPKNSTEYNVYYTDLNGKNKIELNYIRYYDYVGIPNPFSNTLTVSETSLFWVNWRFDIDVKVWKVGKTTWIGNSEPLELHTKNVIVGIAANYKVKDRIRDINDCKALTSLVRNNSEGPFCVYGVKVIGQSHCKCTSGYIGDRCNVSLCENYCTQGNCSVNEEGLPTCRCNAGYLGEKCEVAACHNYCLNNGVCSLNEEDQPSCECVSGYEGSRCEAVQTVKLAKAENSRYR